MHLNSCLKDLVRPVMNSSRPDKGFTVEAADIAVRLVKAHQAVDPGDSLERGVNSRIHRGFGRPRDLDLHEGTE